MLEEKGNKRIMKKNKSQKSYLKILLIILAGVVLLVAGYFGWNFYQSRKQVQVPIINQQEVSMGYSKYNDIKLGFSIEYPEGWKTTPELCKDQKIIPIRCTDYPYPFKILGEKEIEIHQAESDQFQYELLMKNIDNIFKNYVANIKTNDYSVIYNQIERGDNYLIGETRYKSFTVNPDGIDNEFYLNNAIMIIGLGDNKFFEFQVAYTDNDLAKNPNVRDEIIKMYKSVKSI